jgi:putative CocE/NonD family hydrolase
VPRRILVVLAATALAITGIGSFDAPPTQAAVRAAAPPPVLPAPTYQSVAKEVLVPMDDGVRIAATVTFPSKDGSTPAPGRFPVVLSMTPYGRNGVCGCGSPAMFATRGMVSVVADVRGTGGSEGDLEGNYFSPREARDGYLLVEHFAVQPYSTGRVGMSGGSYVGITQYLTAEQQPPHLAVIVPQVAISDLYRDGFAHGGIENLSFDLQYIAVQGAPGSAGTNTDPYLLEETLKAKLGQSPPGTIAFDYLSRPNDDAFYRDRSPIYRADRITVPVLDIGSWNDGLLRGETEMYSALAKRKGVETRLYMDPCTHKGCGAPFAPLTNPPGQYDLAPIIFEFLAKYLQDKPTPARAPVEYYVQSKNTYRTSTTWPPTGTTLSRLALEPGALVPAGPQPSKPGSTQQYVSNPAAGFSMAFNRYGTVAASPYIPTDQRLEGAQGLTFRTAPQKTALPLAGPLALHLVAASDATDTDWYAKVSDVAPDGSETFVTEGALRASHRALDAGKSTPARPYHSHTNPQPLVPGRFYDYDVEIWPTAYELAAGHRLQLRLTSSDLPTHLPGTVVLDRDNPTTARIDLLPPATNTIRMSQSFLTLSVTGVPVSAAPAQAAAPTSAPAPTGSLAATGPGPALPAAAVLLLVVAVTARRRSAR